MNQENVCRRTACSDLAWRSEYLRSWPLLNHQPMALVSYMETHGTPSQMVCMSWSADSVDRGLTSSVGSS
jgi:hypothetical protein